MIKLPTDYLSPEQIYEEALIKASRMYFEAFELDDPREVLAIAEAYNHEATPLLLHFVMFIPALMGHCRDEQQAKWLPDAIELKIVGTYAQTELGHGSYLKGLQTRADYDRKRQVFTLNTPTLESIKWWPGGLGKTANFAIVLAQLHHEGIHRGLHPFIVQIRDLETHHPLPGIEVGEIGPKMGFKAADNGYLRLTNVVIPRTHMLMKNATIDEDGNYQATQETSKLNLGTMLFVRVIVIDMISYNVSKAATIATRYSAIRCQGPNPDADESEPKTREMKILDYSAQMYKLLPAIALGQGFKAVFVSLMTSFKNTTESVSKRADFEMIPMLHAMSSGLKALTTELSSAAIEVCRMACGGQGFLLASGLPRIYANTVAACTYEGENTILYLQTAKYLYKLLTERRNQYASLDEEASSSVGYLIAQQSPSIGDIFSGEEQKFDCHSLCRLFMAAAYYRVHRSVAKVHEKMKVEGFSFEKAWIRSQIELIKGAKSHLIFYFLTKYHEWTLRAQTYDTKVFQVISKLCQFYLLHLIRENEGNFLAVGIPLSYIENSASLMEELMHQLRPDLIPLVDAFDIHDMVLMSAIGKFSSIFISKKVPLKNF